LTQITDAGLKSLEGLTNLTKLNLKATKVSEDGLARLQTALLQCRIEHDGGVIEPK
jgi:hypothetical protein